MKETIKVRVNPTIHRDVTSEAEKRWIQNMSPKLKENARKWKEYPEKQIVERVPIHIQLEPTTRCNLGCIMCPRTIAINKKQNFEIGDFDFELYKKIIDEGSKKGLCSIKYGHLGEPLIHPKMVDMISYANSREIETIMSTNGTLLNADISKELIEAGLTKLFISFDSPNRDHYNKIRVRSNYDRVLGNICRFHEIRKTMGSINPLTRVSMVMMKENEHEWEDYKKLFSGLVDRVEYVDFVHHNNMEQMNEKFRLDRNKRDNKYCCPQLWQRVLIFTDGCVTICCLDSAKKMVMGDLKKQTLEEIWSSHRYAQVRNLHSTGRCDDIPICKGCDMTYTIN